MTEELKNYEKSIKKKHSFAWTPSYQESFVTEIEQKLFVPIVLKVLEKLEWDIVYQDKISVEAKCAGNEKKWTEKIIIHFEYGNVVVKSVSLSNEMWDNGKNSKRVKLFIHAFRQFENKLDEHSITSLNELNQKIEDENNWKNYEVPTSLPQPTDYKKPQFWIPVFGGIISSLLLGFLVALVSIQFMYIFGVFELVVAGIIGFIFGYLAKWSNYTNSTKLDYLLIGMMVLVYLSNQYFQYHIILFENNYEAIGFIEFMKIRLEQGLVIESLNIGWIGLIISWGFQLFFTYYLSSLYTNFTLIAYQIQKVPTEVIDFTFYHLAIKEETEEEVRNKLSKMGWQNTLQQDEVFEAIGAIYGANEFNRIA